MQYTATHAKNKGIHKLNVYSAQGVKKEGTRWTNAKLVIFV